MPSIEVQKSRIPDVRTVRITRIEDERGSFSESYNAAQWANAGLPTSWVQDNHVVSYAAGTVRGLHFQLPPFATSKTVRVLRGSIFDVAVDLRRSSPTFGQHVSYTLTADPIVWLVVPSGFAHGYCSLEPDTEVEYKVTEHWAPNAEGGILWNDPGLHIDWPINGRDALLSERDRDLPLFADVDTPFD